jgi:hypothetical protein
VRCEACPKIPYNEAFGKEELLREAFTMTKKRSCVMRRIIVATIVASVLLVTAGFFAT